MVKEYLKNKILGTQYEWESHIDNLIRLFNRNLKEYTPVNLLDIGCGSGDRTLRVADYFRIDSRNILGFEYDMASIEKSKDLFQVVKIDLETDHIPVKSESFDLVVCNQVLEHLKNYKKVIDEIIGVTKTGGYFVIGIPNLAHLINRILLLVGIQPMCIHPDSTHVRGFTHRDFKKVFTSYQDVRLVDFKGALMYPLPFFIAKRIADYFTGLTGYVCYLFKKT